MTICYVRVVRHDGSLKHPKQVMETIKDIMSGLVEKDRLSVREAIDWLKALRPNLVIL